MSKVKRIHIFNLVKAWSLDFEDPLCSKMVPKKNPLEKKYPVVVRMRVTFDIWFRKVLSYAIFLEAGENLMEKAYLLRAHFTWFCTTALEVLKRYF